MIASYLTNGFTKDDIAYLMHPEKINVTFYEELLKSDFQDYNAIKKDLALKSRFIFKN